VAAFMDREKVTKPTAQIGFIKFVLIPMFETVMKVSEISHFCCSFKCYFYSLHHLLTLICSSQLFPQIEEIMVQPLRDSRDHYEELKQIDDAMTEVNAPQLIVCNLLYGNKIVTFPFRNHSNMLIWASRKKSYCYQC